MSLTSAKSWRFALPLATGTLVVMIRALAGDLTSTWERGLFGNQGSWYTGRIARNLDRYGFETCRFGAPLHVLPAEPPLTVQYRNHPPTYFLLQGYLYRHFGRTPAPIKIFHAVFYLLLGVAVVCLFPPERSVAAAVAGTAAVALPLGSFWGFMPATHYPCLVMGVFGLAAFRRWRRRRDRFSPFLMGVCLFIAGVFDWWGWFAFPAIAAHLVLFERPLPWRALIGLVLLACGIMAASFLQLAHMAQGAEEATAGLGRLAMEGSARAVGDFNFIEWHGAQGQFLVAAWTLPGLILAMAGISRGLLIGRGRIILLLAVFGIPNLYVFAGHSASHAFWINSLLPLLAVGVGLAFEPLLGALNRHLRLAGAAALLVTATYGIFQGNGMYEEIRGSGAESVAAWLNARTQPDDIVLAPLDLSQVEFHLHAACFGPIHTVEEIDAILRLLEGRRLKGRLIFIDLPGLAPSELIRALESRSATELAGGATTYVLR